MTTWGNPGAGSVDATKKSDFGETSYCILVILFVNLILCFQTCLEMVQTKSRHGIINSM
jgi:hypothetical protein